MHRSSLHCSGSRFAVVLIASVSLAATAQARQPAQAWQVERGKQYCAMGAGLVGATPLTFGFRMVPGTEVGQLIFARRGESFAKFQFGEKVSVTAGPSGARYEGWARTAQRGDVRTLLIEGIDPAILSALSAPVELRVASGDDIRLKVPFPAEGGARLAFQKCIDAALKEWGVDPQRQASLKQRPRLGARRTWITPDDYPALAVRQGISGDVVIRVAVEADGRVSRCDVVVSSGSAELDGTTCRVTRQRARLDPAIGADGAPTAADMVTTVRWWVE